MPTRRVFQGFTLVELLIVISIIGTLVAMLLPAINSARERGRQTVCSARMQQIGIALAKATANKRGTTRSVNGEPVSLLHPSLLQPNPNAADEWQRKGTLAAELQEVEDVWKCPSAMPGSTSFGFNERLGWMGSRDGGRIAIVEYNTNTLNNEQSVVQVVGTPLTDIWDNDDGSWDTNDRFAPRHFEMANVFTHGKSVTSYTPETIDPSDCYNQFQYWVPNRYGLTKMTWGTAKRDETLSEEEEPNDPYFDQCTITDPAN